MTKLSVDLEGDTLILRGEVASEDCKGDAKRLLLGFDSVFKVRNELVVAGFLEPASDEADDYFGRIPTHSDRDVFNFDIGSMPPSTALPDPSETEIRKKREMDVTEQTTDLGQEAPILTLEVMRHPEIAMKGTLSPGQEVRVEIDLSMASLQGEPAMSLGLFPTDWDKIAIRVQLFAVWAAEVITENETITIAADGTSDPACFRLVVSDGYEFGSSAQVQASFLHGTRVCGHLSHDLAISVDEIAKKHVSKTSNRPEPKVTIVPEAIGPSLSIQIICNEDGTQTWAWVASVPGGVRQAYERIKFNHGGQEFAQKLLASCPDLKPGVFRRLIAGIGERLWEAAPAHFRSEYTKLRAELGKQFPIQFISDDPHIPWEMMKPGLEGVDHLFLEHPVARWPLSNAGLLRHQFPGGALLSFVPNYPVDRALPSAKTEGEWLCAHLSAVEGTATSDGFLDILDGNHPVPIGILHFAGHGSVDTGIFDGGIDMEDRTIGISEVNQNRVVLGSQDGTLVVLNACETSAGSRLLGMNTGWGATIAARDFGGLVAPLWEVQDDVALAIVQEALPSLVEGSCSLGEALLRARRLQSDISISAFAYLAHGDVMAKFSRS